MNVPQSNKMEFPALLFKQICTEHRQFTFAASVLSLETSEERWTECFGSDVLPPENDSDADGLVRLMDYIIRIDRSDDYLLVVIDFMLLLVKNDYEYCAGIVFVDAMEQNRRKIMEYMVNKKGVDLEMRCYGMGTALEITTWSGSADMMIYLIALGSKVKKDALYTYACWLRDVLEGMRRDSMETVTEKIDILLLHGADLDADYYGDGKSARQIFKSVYENIL